MLKEFFLTFAFLFFTFTFFDQLPAQCDSIGWSNDPSVNLNVSSWGQNPHAVSDGDGGVYILWNTNSYTTFQYLQHVDRCGIIQWTAPVEIRGEWNGTRFYPDLTEDGFGGVIVSYTEQNVSQPQPLPGRVRVNRIDNNGNLLWGSHGVRVSLQGENQSTLNQVVPDGTGGAIVSFGVLEDSLYIQRISATGQRLWGDEGILVTDTSGLNFDHILISDKQGGAIIQWYGYDTGFKRYDSNGNLLWYTHSPNINLYYSNIIPDGTGGAVMSGTEPSSYRSVIANRISPDGIFLWGNMGIILSDSVGLIQYKGVDITLESDGTAAFTWTEKPDFFTIYIQKLSSNGQKIWPQNILVSQYPSSKSDSQILKSDDDNILIMWNDARNNGDGIYAQKIDSMGYLMWADDVVITQRDIFESYESVPDNNGGGIAAWTEAQLNGIFVQQISKFGNLGEILTSINAPIDDIIPRQFTLYQNFPNPFNSSSVIRFSLTKLSEVKLTIFNLLGEEIKTLVQGAHSPGVYEIIWNGEDDLGFSVASGIYFYRIIVNKEAITKKMLFQK